MPTDETPPEDVDQIVLACTACDYWLPAPSNIRPSLDLLTCPACGAGFEVDPSRVAHDCPKSAADQLIVMSGEACPRCEEPQHSAVADGGRSAGGSEQLPLKPSRDNYSRDCTLVEEDDNLPDHLTACTCPNHDGVCETCGYKITVGPSGREYGHGRANNRAPDNDGVRRDCPHRPLSCNPGEPHAWEGYGKDEWNANDARADGGRSLATESERSAGGDAR